MADATHIPFAELHGIAEMEYARVHENERRPVTIANIYSITTGKAVPTNSSFERKALRIQLAPFRELRSCATFLKKERENSQRAMKWSCGSRPIPLCVTLRDRGPLVPRVPADHRAAL